MEPKPFFTDGTAATRWALSYLPTDQRLYQDLRTLGARACSVGSAEAWHHFLMTVGNFKRQRGAIIRAFLPSKETAAADVASLEVHTGGAPFTLYRDDTESTSWRKLDAIAGISVATASTALAALWPNHHAILDVRTRRVSIALAAANDDDVLIDGGPESNRNDKADDWDRYQWYIERLLLTAKVCGVAALDVERTLFLVEPFVPEDPARSWRDIGEEFVRVLAEDSLPVLPRT